MKKIPTMFDRDWDGDRSRVLDKPHPDCAWVFAGEGVATQKLDGSCCMVRGGRLFKRRELRDGDERPPFFELEGVDPETKKAVGWLPVGDGPEDRYFNEAMAAAVNPTDGTYELIGPKVQGNPEGQSSHKLASHALADAYPNAPRTFEGLRVFLNGMNIEGLVFHHPDGRMAKIKLRDFGLKRQSKP